MNSEQSAGADLVDLAHVGVTTLSGIIRRARWRLSLPHRDDHPVLIWITKGHSRATAAAHTNGLGPFSAVFVPAGCPWSFDPGPSLQAQMVRLPDTPVAPFPQQPTVLRVRSLEDQKDFSSMVDAIARSDGTRLGQREQLAYSVLLSAWIERHDESAGGKRPKSIRLAADYAMAVEACIGTGKNLADIGAEMDITPTHLTRTLKQTCGLTAAQYLTDRVMHEARVRLVDTNQSAAQIARDLGYSSPAYFSRAFVAHAGVPPGEFRAVRKQVPQKIPA